MINEKSAGLPSADEINIPALKEKYRQARDGRMRKEGQTQYVRPVDDFADAYDADPYTPLTPRKPVSEDLDIAAKAYFRLRLSYAVSRRHELSLLYAPLTLKASGLLPAAVNFEGVLFPAGAAVDGIYTFNSYRLTYRYRLLDKPRLRLDIGLTAKIRDAEIALASTALSASKTNVGFVPLLHVRLDWDWTGTLGLLCEIDAAAAKQGRAEDVLLALTWRVSPQLRLRLGYRFVEGGADVDEVYNFAWIHYLAAGLAFVF